MRIAPVPVLCAICALAAASAQIDTSRPLWPKQKLVSQDGFPADALANYQHLLNYLIVRSWVETPANTGVISISPPDPSIGWSSYSQPETIFEVPSTPSGQPAFPTIAWLGFLHELVIANDLPSSFIQNDLFDEEENLSSALTDLMVMAVEKANPSLFQYPPTTVTCAGGIAGFANRRNAVFGGAGTGAYLDYYSNVVFDNAGCSPYALFTNAVEMNFISFTNAINAHPPTSHAQVLAILDSLVPEFEGVPPSLWFEKNNPLAFGGMPSGQYLGAKQIGFSWFGSNEDNYFSDINPEFLDVRLVNWRSPTTDPSLNESLPNAIVAPSVCWSMLDSTGKEVIPLQFGNSSTMYDVDFDITHQFGGSWYTQYPTGSYLVPVAYSPDGAICSTDPRLTLNQTIGLVDKETMGTLKPGDLVVSVNGPKWGTLPMKGSYDIQLVAPSSATITSWPDMVIVTNIPKRSDGSSQEVTLQVTYSDGTVRIRTFQPDWAQPIGRTIVDKDEPTLVTATVQRSTDGGFSAAIAPGEILSIYGKDLTGNAPCGATSLPIPVDGSCGNALNDQGRTRVLFTVTSGSQTGTQLFGRPLYVGTTQINVVVPSGLPTGENVSVQVVVNGTVSFQAMTTVGGATDPGVFMIDAAQHAAVIDATTGKILALNGATASAGDILEVFGTGLGQKKTPVPDGTACPGVDWAAVPVTATIGGEPAPVSYAGCAPGYAGLDQINLTVPFGLASGDQPLIVMAGGVSSTSTMVPIQ